MCNGNLIPLFGLVQQKLKYNLIFSIYCFGINIYFNNTLMVDFSYIIASVVGMWRPVRIEVIVYISVRITRH